MPSYSFIDPSKTIYDPYKVAQKLNSASSLFITPQKSATGGGPVGLVNAPAQSSGTSSGSGSSSFGVPDNSYAAGASSTISNPDTSQNKIINAELLDLPSANALSADYLKQLQNTLTNQINLISTREANTDAYNKRMEEWRKQYLDFLSPLFSGQGLTGYDIGKDYTGDVFNAQFKKYFNPTMEKLNLSGNVDSGAMNQAIANKMGDVMAESQQNKVSGQEYLLSLLNNAPTDLINTQAPITPGVFNDILAALNLNSAKQSTAFNQLEQLKADNLAKAEAESAKLTDLNKNTLTTLNPNLNTDKTANDFQSTLDSLINYFARIESEINPGQGAGYTGSIKQHALADAMNVLPMLGFGKGSSFTAGGGGGGTESIGGAAWDELTSKQNNKNPINSSVSIQNENPIDPAASTTNDTERNRFIAQIMNKGYSKTNAMKYAEALGY